MILASVNERHAVLSPNGMWIAYSSDESGREEVYVRSFPTGDRKWLISSEGRSTGQHELDQNRFEVEW